jgi:hypothetical protein
MLLKAILLFLLLPSFAQADITTGLVLHCSFSEGTGTSTACTGSAAVTGTITASPVVPWLDGRIGRGLLFTTSSQRIDLGSASAVDDIELSGTGMSGSAWVYSTVSGPQKAIFNKNNVATTTNGAHLFAVSNQQIWFEKSYSTTVLRRATSATIPLNAWTHVAFTWDGSATVTNVKIYINGVEAAYNAGGSTSGVGSKVSDAASNLYINDGVQSRTFFGGMDEVRIYNRVLTADDVMELYQEGMAFLIMNDFVGNDFVYQ